MSSVICLSKSTIDKIIESGSPKGLYYYSYIENEKEVFVAIDNTADDIITNKFNNRDECLKWLRRNDT